MSRPRETKFYECLGLKGICAVLTHYSLTALRATGNYNPSEEELKKAYKKAAMKVRHPPPATALCSLFAHYWLLTIGCIVLGCSGTRTGITQKTARSPRGDSKR